MASFFRKIIIPSLVIGHWSLVILTSGCGDLETGVGSLSISPTSATVGINKTQLFSAIAKDALGKIVSSSPVWSVTGGIGSISSTGLFTAGASEASGYVLATVGSINTQVAVTITAKGWLSGRVSETSTGNIQGIQVLLKQLPAYTEFTDSNGRYTISGIPPGTYEAQTKETTLYYSTSQEVTISSGETVTWNPSLTIKASAPTIPTTTIPTVLSVRRTRP